MSAKAKVGSLTSNINGLRELSKGAKASCKDAIDREMDRESGWSSEEIFIGGWRILGYRGEKEVTIGHV